MGPEVLYNNPRVKSAIQKKKSMDSSGTTANEGFSAGLKANT